MKTQKEYVAAGGAFCPFCGGDDVETTAGIQVDGAQAWQEVMCNTCDKSWTDQYALVAYNPTGPKQ
jgi:transposase-like protein